MEAVYAADIDLLAALLIGVRLDVFVLHCITSILVLYERTEASTKWLQGFGVFRDTRSLHEH